MNEAFITTNNRLKLINFKDLRKNQILGIENLILGKVIIIIKLKNFKVKDLFGLYDYSIILNNEGLDILYGPNGSGKTTLLNMIYIFFENNIYELTTIPFKSFILFFTDSSNIIITKNKIDSSGLKILFEKEGEKKKEFSIDIEGDLRDYFSKLRDIDKYQEYSRALFETKSEDFIFSIKKNKPYLPKQPFSVTPFERIYKEILKEKGQWLLDFTSKFKYLFIKAERLIKLEKIIEEGRRKEERYESTIKAYSMEIKNKINELITEYGNQSQQIDQSFPNRVLKTGEKKQKALSSLEAQQGLSDLQSKINELILLGILKRSPQLMEIEKIDDFALKMLEVYIPDVRQKIAIFEDFARKLKVFMNLTNNLFIDKKMIINSEEGMIFQNKREKKLYPDHLSSGEQHELIILYELLFKVEDGALILIDEPEISLHLAWQRKFIENILKIADLKKSYYILATHSPQIIQDKMYLTHDLGKKNDS